MSWVRLHPFTRITIVLGVIIGAASFSGWERVGEALANFSPKGSFENRCDDLPTSAVEVALQAFRVTENRGLPFATLTEISEGPSTSHRTIGLTRANFGHRSTVDVKGFEDRLGGRACVRPQLKVELYLEPLTVYVAREYGADPCRAEVIRGHEQRHVEVYLSYAREAVARLAGELSTVVGTRPHFGPSVAETQRELDRRIGDTLSAFMRDSEREIAQRQGLVDTPEEYARVSNACTAQ